MSREQIALTLKRLRMKSGLTADEVGTMVGKSGKTVNAWENNRGQPDAEILMKLCDIYEVDDILKEFRENEKDDNYLHQPLSKIISTQRKKVGLSQKELAELMGVKENEIIYWEKGILIPDDILKLSKILKIDPYFLLPKENSIKKVSDSFPSSDLLSIHERMLFKNFLKLNETGKNKLIEYSDDLIGNEKYIKKNKK